MKLRSSLLVALSVLSPVLSSPQVILHPAPSTNSKNIPSLSPIETNAIVAHHLGLAGVFDWLIEEVKESWHYLFDAAYVHPLAGKDASVSSGDVSSLFLIVKSDHPEGSWLPTESGYSPDRLGRLQTLSHQIYHHHSASHPHRHHHHSHPSLKPTSPSHTRHSHPSSHPLPPPHLPNPS
jgi:hypothetical protein